MEEQIFDAKKIPWVEDHHGRSKILLGDNFSKTSRFRLFNLKAGERFNTHEHDFTQCMYFTSGEGYVTIDDAQTEIYSGLTVVVLPQQCHAIMNKGKEEMNIIVVEIHEVNHHDNPFIDF